MGFLAFPNRISCFSKQDFLWQETRLPLPKLAAGSNHPPCPRTGANQENPVTFLPLCVKLRKTWFLSSNDETRWIPFLGLSTQLLVEERVERRGNYPDEANVGVITRYKILLHLWHGNIFNVKSIWNCISRYFHFSCMEPILHPLFSSNIKSVLYHFECNFGFIFEATQVWKHIKVTTEHLEPVKQFELKIWLKFQLGPKVLAKFDQNLWKCSKD